MKTSTILTTTVAGVLGFVAIKAITGMSILPKTSKLYLLLHPEEKKLFDQKEAERVAKERYWAAYIDTRTTAQDRVAVLTSALNPIMPGYLFGYPFLDLSFGQMNPVPYPGLPTPQEWQEILNQKLKEAIQTHAAEQGQGWIDNTSWPTP